MWIGRGMLILVPYIIVYVGVSSFYLMVGIATPRALVPSTLLHIAVAVTFEFQILWHFFVTVLTPPGSPTKGIEFGTLRAAADDRLRAFSLCRRCEAPRPYGTHHCSTCGNCAYDLDHHCIFVHNCIGYANRRSFFLFCFFALLGCVYPLIMLGLSTYWDASAMARIVFPQCMPFRWQRLFARFNPDGLRPYSAYSGGFSPACSAGPTRQQPSWMIQREDKLPDGFLPTGRHDECLDRLNTVVLLMLVTKSFCVIVSVGFLLSQQIYLLAYNTTSLQVQYKVPLRASTFLGRWRLGLANIFKYTGPLHTWLLPRTGPWPAERGGWPEPRRLTALSSTDCRDGPDGDACAR